VFDPITNSWKQITSKFLKGYTGFDNSGGGAWTKYVNIPITTIPSEYAQYKVVIDSSNITVYSADGTQKAQGAVASDFWANVKSDGSDIRAFDQAKEQLYFWIEEWDYANKTAVIWVNLTAGSSELNIAYGNPSAAKSDYENPTQVFELFDDFEAGEIIEDFYTFWGSAVWTVTTENVKDGAYSLKADAQTTTGEVRAYLANTSLADAFIAEVWVYAWRSSTATEDNTPAGIAIRDLSDSVYTIMISDADLEITKYSNSTTGTLKAQYSDFLSIPYEGWFKLYIIYDGQTLLAKCYDTQESLLASTSAEVALSTVDIGLVIWRNYAYFDNIRVLKLTDPADFGTPQVLSF